MYTKRYDTNLNNNKNEKKINFIDLITLIYVGYTLFPTYSDKTLYISLILFGFWTVVACLTNVSLFQTALSDSHIACVVLFAVYIFISGIWVAGFLFTIKQVLTAIMHFSYIVIFSFYLRSNQSYKLKKFFYIFIVLFVFVQIITLRFYLQNEGAARDLAKDSSYYGDINGVGGYSFAYSCAIFSVVVLNVILDRMVSGFFKKILLLSIIVLSVFVIISTESTITLVAYTIGVFICVFFRKNKYVCADNAKALLVIRIVAVVILMMLMSSILQFIGEFLIDVSSNLSDALSRRLGQLGATLVGDIKNGSYTLSRMRIPLDSFKTFLENPITGVSHKHGNGFYKPSLFGAGNHCEWVDALTNYGLIGGIPYLTIYVKQVKKIGKLFSGFSIAWIICMFVMGLFNPFRTFSSHIILFFMIPSLAFILGEESRKEE